MLKIVGGFVKALALVGGLVVTVLSLMAVGGLWIDSNPARLALALIVALAIPAILADRALGLVGRDKQRGVTTDVLAVSYALFSLGFVGIAHGATRPLLTAEGERLGQAGLHRSSQAAYFLAGGHRPTISLPIAVVTPPPAVAPPTIAPAAAGDLRSADNKERSPAELFKEFAPSVVAIHVTTPFGEGGGTGFVIDAQGTIGTNHHVIDRASKIEVKLMDGTVADSVEILAESPDHDLALIRITTKAPLTPVILGDSEKVTVGERVVSIGNPLGLEHTLTDGVISARRVIETRKMIQMSAPVSPGNSGGPLFNTRGEVVGVTTAIYAAHSVAQNLNLAMPINDVRAMLRAEYPERHAVGTEASRGGRW